MLNPPALKAAPTLGRKLHVRGHSRSYFGRLMRLAPKVTLWTALTLSLLIAVTQFVLTLRNQPKAFPGYTLVAPVLSTKTDLIDMQGRAVRTWESDYTAGRRRVRCSKMATCCVPASFPRRNDFLEAPKPAAGFKNSRGTANSSGTSNSTTRSKFPTTTSPSCPTATCS